MGIVYPLLCIRFDFNPYLFPKFRIFLSEPMYDIDFVDEQVEQAGILAVPFKSRLRVFSFEPL